MGNRIRKLKKGEQLFKEGDRSDAMYIIKTGRVAVTKNKGNSSITLAELKNGDMLGEMAFFEKAPRSAGAKAVSHGTEIIELPFEALNKQYEALPIWVKAVMKAVNNHLHRANQKIRQLEKTLDEENEVFSPHTITQLCSILGFVSAQYGQEHEKGVQIPAGLLRTYTIQIFKLPTYKMQTLVETMCDFGYMELENKGGGKQLLIMKDVNFVFKFVEFYNNQIFSDKAKKLKVNASKLKSLKTLIFYGNRAEKNGKGNVTLNVTDAAKASMKEMGSSLSVADVKAMCEVGLLGEHTNDGTSDFVDFNLDSIEEITAYWDLAHQLKSFQNQ